MTKTKKKHFIIILIFILLILISMIGLFFFFIYQQYYKVAWNSSNFEETTSYLSNPDCGWYHIYGYSLSDESKYTTQSILDACAYDTDNRLALVEINLKAYRSENISNYALNQLETILTAFRQTNKKLILRFLYDWDGKALESEPDNIDIILNHMTQLGPVINKYVDSIYTLQGIFVGNCGEMNNSSYMSADDMCLLMNQLASVTDSSLFLSVRTPAHWRQITESLTPLSNESAFTGVLSSRIGLFNDGMLGSGNDCGTYGDTPVADATQYADKRLRADEIDFQNQLCLYVPNGGEVILDNSYNDLTNAVTDLSNMHISYLDCDYDAAVLNKWKNTTYESNDSFNGCSGYDFIGTHLGYRYVLRSSDMQFSTFQDKTASLHIDLDNVGFANSYQDFSVQLHIQSNDTDTVYDYTLSTNTSTWYNNETITLSAPIDIRTYGVGNYSVYFSLSDSNQNQIQFANTLTPTSMGYLIGSFTVEK